VSRTALEDDYVSQHLDPVERRQSRAQLLREQLERSEKSVSFPAKRKGMWIRTYQTKMRRISELEHKVESALRERILRRHL